MTVLIFSLIVFMELCSVTGQVFFKLAMGHSSSRKRTVTMLGLGISALTLDFLIWMGLLSRFELSYLYPFDGLNRILLVVAAMVFLKEKMNWRLWVGMAFITVGVLFVLAT